MRDFRPGGPLEERGVPSEWANLLDAALPALDHALGGEEMRIRDGAPPRWTLGGGTALALRMGHRISDDIDVFLTGTALGAMTPAKNPAARGIAEKFQWPGHFLKFERDEGEVDFLASALQTTPGFTLAYFRRRVIALETIDEVIVKKIRYRAAQFTARDAFDLAAAVEHRPEVVAVIAREVADALPRLGTALGVLERKGPEAVTSKVRAAKGHVHLLDQAVGRSNNAMRAAVNLSDPSRPAMRVLAEAIGSVDWFEPGRETGRIRFGWSKASEGEISSHRASIEALETEAKAMLIERWQLVDREGFRNWHRGGRAGTDAGPELARAAPRGTGMTR